MIMSCLPGGGNPEPINVTVHGAVYETVSIKDVSTNQIITCDTDSTGEGMATLIAGCKYILTGSISGYTSEEQKVTSDNADLYAMPLGALYWCGNECSKVSGGWVFPVSTTNHSFFDNCNNNGSIRRKNTNEITISFTGKFGYGNVASAYTANIVDLSNYTKIKAIVSCSSTSSYGYIYLGSYTSKPDGKTWRANLAAYDMLDGSSGTFHIPERSFEINISNITDKEYINVFCFENNEPDGGVSIIGVIAKIHKIWLE